MKLTIFASALFLASIGAVSVAHAADSVPPVQDTAWPGTLKLSVDATDLAHRIFTVHESIPVSAGKLTFLYPAWIPGHHSPTGPIDKFAGLKVSANGKPLVWTRDQYNVYAFSVDVPAGVTSIDVDFQFLSSQGGRQGRVMMTPEMLSLQWDAVSVYPAGHNIRMINITPSVTLPDGWHFATALEQGGNTSDSASGGQSDGSVISFDTVTYNVLVDSPMLAGKNFKRVDLDPGAKAPVHMDMFADDADDLKITPEQIKIHRNIVKQMYKLYGAHHYNHYDFLMSLSHKLGGIGLEHHRSSEDSVGADYFTKWKKGWAGRDLLTHEFNHSWDGKYRRGADLTTPNFNVPMGDSLLWVYEGQTQFWGNVVAARSGLVSKDQALAKLAYVAAAYDRGRPGLEWRTLQDTTNDPTIAQRAPLPYRNYQMSEDYYSGGQMVWLAVDAKLRALTRNKRSLDDFAKAFFGMENGVWTVNTYVFEDIVKTLNTIAPFDWDGFLRQRLDGHGSLIDGIAASGWKLTYTDKPDEAMKSLADGRRGTGFTYSLGFNVSSKGEMRDVLWNSPAFKAGLAPSMTLVAVNGQEFDGDALKAAVVAAKDNDKPIELLVKDGNAYKTISIDYHGGMQYPHLERVKGTHDYLSELYAPAK